MSKNSTEHIKPKERAIRYYGYAQIASKLYKASQNGKVFKNISNLLITDDNIAQAYRSIKTNKGAKTKGSDGQNIINLSNIKLKRLQKLVEEATEHYIPKAVRRVMIPKKTPGEFRPLGIPTTFDKLIQQIIKQILEPILEAKFVTTSYGFRLARNQHQAIEHIQRLIAQGEYTHAVEFDIKKYFDNISHEILLEILYREGIQDRKMLMLVKAILKAPVKGIGIPEKGTPQGGVLSPLLANTYLNELDKFIYSKFQDLEKKIKTYRKKYHTRPVHIVRFADDFCVFTKSRKDAIYYMNQVICFLRTQLKLEHSPEKTRITNMKKRAIKFLGIKIKAVKSKNQKIKHLVAKSYIPKESVKKLAKKAKSETALKKRISIVRGAFNYWSIATGISQASSLYNNLLYRKIKKKPKKKDLTQNPTQNYVEVLNEGLNVKIKYRQSLLACQDSFLKNLEKLSDLNINNWYKDRNDSIEKYDIIRSKYRTQQRKDPITKEPLFRPHCHRIIPHTKGGKYTFTNCMLVNDWTHRIIHGTFDNLVRFCRVYKLKNKVIQKLAMLFKKAH